MRKRLWQLHSWLGLGAGLGLLVIGLTGSLLVFRDQLEVLFNPTLIRIATPDTPRLPLDTLLARAQSQLPGHEISGWTLREPAERDYADFLYVIGRGSDQWRVATLDPTTGRILATPRAYTATLSGWLLDLHYEFFADHIGLAFAGLFAVLLCLLGVTGVWIYREFWKNLFTLRWRRGARILFSDLHKFTGITTVVFNLILGFTGAYWNLTHVIGEAINGEFHQPKMERRLYSAALSLDALVADAATRLPGFRPHFISLPSAPAGGITFYGAVERRSPLRSPYGSTVSYDATMLAHTATADLRSSSLWLQFVDVFRPLHFGTFGGLPVKILWSLGGLAPGLLAVTGFVIWRTRISGRRSGI